MNFHSKIALMIKLMAYHRQMKRYALLHTFGMLSISFKVWNLYPKINDLEIKAIKFDFIKPKRPFGR